MKKEEDDDEVRWKTRQSGNLKKSKKGRLGLKKKLDARQYAIFGGIVFLTSWGLAVTFLLLNLGIMYNFSTVPTTREDYSVKGAAEWAKKQAAEDLMQGIEVWNVINGSIMGWVYRTPTDYTNLGNVLRPVFDTMPALYSIELAFNDRASQVTLTRRKGGTDMVMVGPSSLMQASSADCFLMGVEGCASQPLTMPLEQVPRPLWYKFGLGIPSTAYGGAISWWMDPEIVVQTAADGGDLLTPAVRLMFNLAFPKYYDKNGAYAVVVGRITLSLSALGGSRLKDERLGDEGKILLVDAGARVLASQEVMDVLGVEYGRVRFRSLYEAGRSWGASSVMNAFRVDVIKEMKTQSDKTFIAVEPLPSPLGRFGIVVVAPSREPFQNVALVGTSAIASIVAPAPYVLAGGFAVLFIIGQCFATMRKNDGKVGFEAMSKGGRKSISDTISGVHGKDKLPQRKSMMDSAKGKLTAMRGSLFGGNF